MSIQKKAINDRCVQKAISDRAKRDDTVKGHNIVHLMDLAFLVPGGMSDPEHMSLCRVAGRLVITLAESTSVLRSSLHSSLKTEGQKN